MQSEFYDSLGVSRVSESTPPLSAYGLELGAKGYRIADLHCAPTHEVRSVTGIYTSHAVALVLDGSFDYAPGSATAVPGSMVLANVREEFSCVHLSDAGNRRLVLFVSAALMEEAAGELQSNDARFSAATAPPSQITPRMLAWLVALANGDGDEATAFAVLQAALRLGQADRAKEVTPDDRRRVLDVVRYVNAHFAERCLLTDLASLAGMSKFRLARTFGAVTGETPNQYLLNRRLAAAAMRLAHSHESTIKIAYETGFNDLPYFYARFRRVFGDAPGRWRRAQAGSDPRNADVEIPGSGKFHRNGAAA